MSFQLLPLTHDHLQEHVQDFIRMLHNNLEDEYWEAEHFLSPLNRKWELSLYATDSKGQLAGFLIVSEKPASLHIHKFVVDKSAQRTGLGTLMLQHLLSDAQKKISLKVGVNNAGAIQFYTKNGFSISDRHDALYSMTLDL